MNQAKLRHMAEERILDAGALLAANRWSYAYYVAGYAVECGLKSCVLAQMIHTGGIFEIKRFSEQCFTHDFITLLNLAGLKPALEAELQSNTSFQGHWGIASAWKETSRYEQKTRPEAEDLYAAITEGTNGVIPWIRRYW